MPAVSARRGWSNSTPPLPGQLSSPPSAQLVGSRSRTRPLPRHALHSRESERARELPPPGPQQCCGHPCSVARQGAQRFLASPRAGPASRQLARHRWRKPTAAPTLTLGRASAELPPCRPSRRRRRQAAGSGPGHTTAAAPTGSAGRGVPRCDGACEKKPFKRGKNPASRRLLGQHAGNRRSSQANPGFALVVGVHSQNRSQDTRLSPWGYGMQARSGLLGR